MKNKTSSDEPKKPAFFAFMVYPHLLSLYRSSSPVSPITQSNAPFSSTIYADVLPIKSSASYLDEQPASVSVKIIAAKSAAAYLLITLPPPDFPLSYHTPPEFFNKTKKPAEPASFLSVLLKIDDIKKRRFYEVFMSSS